MKPSKPAPDGPITTALSEAVKMRREMLDKGHPAADVDHLVGQGLKAALKHTRSEPWRFYCAHCRDTGWVMVSPSDAEYVRLSALYGARESHAGYVVKCEPCKWTQLEREKRRKQYGQEHDEDDLASVGQTKPARGFKRFGQ